MTSLRKTILLLGGSAQQVVAVDTARRLGYDTVLCDYLPDNPGQYHADRFYQVSTTDKQAILEIARKERIDGIVAYASDPAAPTAAYVAEEMGLPGNPAAAVETLCNKDRFRQFLIANGFHAPVSGGYSDVEAAYADISRFSLPVIVKPVDSSGSKGVSVVNRMEDLRQALEFAFSFSRGKRVIVEEFICKKHPYLIGGDVFVVDGKISLWGLLNCHRDERVNRLVPVGKSYPLLLERQDLENVKKTLQELVDQLQIRSGAMNVELVVDAQDRVWPIDIGPRNGGNMIPELLGYIFDVDIVELTILAAMGEQVRLENRDGTPCYATHNLHAAKAGTFESIRFSPTLSQYIVRKSIYKRPGDPVEYFDNAAKALGILFLKFPDEQTMFRIMEDIHSHIHIQLAREQE